jgi:hypothetical protein
VYRTLLEEARRRNAWGASARDVYDWWTARERRCQALDPIDDAVTVPRAGWPLTA